MPRNQNWYDLNESRLWPFDDSATLLDDKGQRLGNSLLADLHIRFPISLGERAFVSSLTIGPQLVTLTLLGSGPGFNPLGTLSVLRPVDIHRHYAITPAAAGAGGWVVFGSGIEEQSGLVAFRFSSPTQTLLLARTARQYRRLPVTSLGRLYNETRLTGLIRLKGSNDIKTAVEEREINGVLRRVAVIKLADEVDGQTTRNLLREYAGDCGKRPESQNCGDPEPIETINSVLPDCCGNIFLEFRGCGDLSTIADECGVVIDCGFGLGEACVRPDRLPDQYGRLPNEYDDQCAGFVPTTEEPVDVDYETYASTSRDPASGLPYYENFSDLVANDFNSVLGDFVLARGGNGSGVIATITSNASYIQLNLRNAIPYFPVSSIVIEGCSLAAYNTTHNVVAPYSTLTMLTDTLHIADATGGFWREVSAAGEGQLGNVLEAQESRENIMLWTEGTPELPDWDAIYKRITVVMSIQPGSMASKNNGAIVFNYRDARNFWLLQLDLDAERALRFVHIDNGVYKVRGEIKLPQLSQVNRYKLTLTILPLNEAAGSVSAIVAATLFGYDDALEATLSEVVLPRYLPATGYFGLHSDSSLTWFEDFYVENYSP